MAETSNVRSTWAPAELRGQVAMDWALSSACLQRFGVPMSGLAAPCGRRPPKPTPDIGVGPGAKRLRTGGP